MWHEWSTLKKLIWLRFLQGASAIIKTVTGTSPLALENAANKTIKSLIQYGKCATVDGEIYCNNGKLVAVDDELPIGYRRLASVSFDGDAYYNTGEKLNGEDVVKLELSGTSSSGQNVFGCYAGTSAGTKNFSLYLYGAGSSSNSYFRYGEQLLRPRYGSGRRSITFGKGGTDGFASDVSADPEVFVTDSDAWIGMLPNSSSPAFSGNIWGSIEVGTRLEWIPCERQADGVVCYYEKHTNTVLEPNNGTPVAGEYDDSHLTVLVVEGTPEVLTVSGTGLTQTATVQNLFEVNGVADEQDIISGAITRRVEVSVSAGVITLSALATPVTEHTTANALHTSAGDNVVSVVSNVDPVQLKVKYSATA